MSTKHHPSALHEGTNAERLAYATHLLVPGMMWVETDTLDIYVWDGLAWDGPLGAGGGAPHNLLSATHPDTNVAGVIRADIIVGDATPEWARLAKGNAADILRINAAGADVAWEAEFDAVAPNIIQADDLAATGAAVVAARRDHEHGFPCGIPIDTGIANAEGILYDFVRSDHIHKLHDHLHAGVAGDGGTIPHANLSGLIAPADDHTQYLLASGVRALSGAWDVGAHLVTFGAGIAFDGATGVNVITIPDNIADALHVVDAGDANDLLTFHTTDWDREVVINEDGIAYIDFRCEGATNPMLLLVDANIDTVYLGITLISSFTDDEQLQIYAAAGQTVHILDINSAAGGGGDLLYVDATGHSFFALGMEVNAATAVEPVLILQTTDDNATNPILEIQDAAGNMLSEIEKDGNLNFATAAAANPGMIEINDTRFFHTYGTDNLFTGLNAGNFALTGTGIVALGAGAGLAITTGYGLVLIGKDAGTAITIGYDNVAIGGSALKACTTGWDNMAIGGEALIALTTGNANVAIGTDALHACQAGVSNVCIGYGAGESIINATSNMFIGTTAGRNNTGYANTGIGTSALQECTTGDWNIGIGYSAIRNLTTNELNIGIGNESLLFTNGRRNTAIGIYSGRGATGQSFDESVLIGYRAGYALTTGDYNILLGYQAGETITTGASNIIIGYNIDPTGVGVSSELNIGALIYGDLASGRGGVNVTPPSLAAAWHVHQATSDAVIPVLYLDQADVDQDMIEFACTIGVGNAIEAVGGKTLTTTHFIKVTLPGALTRYIPVGTIA